MRRIQDLILLVIAIDLIEFHFGSERLIEIGRPVRMIQMVEQGSVFECCWGRTLEGVCDRCGYGVIAELSALSRLRPASLMHALKLFGAGNISL